MNHLMKEYLCGGLTSQIRPYSLFNKSKLLIKKILFSGIKCQQQDVYDTYGHPEAKRNTGAFQKISPNQSLSQDLTI